MEQILKLQLALFFKSPELRPDTLYSKINEDMGNLFNAMPQIIPIPVEVPHEIPRVSLRSEDNRYNCNIALSRIDIIFNENNANEADWPKITQDFTSKINLFIKSVLSKNSIVRFGLIGNFFIPEKNASQSLTKKYLKIDLGTAEEINLRYNKKISSHNLDLNSIYSLNTATVEKNGSSEKGIYIERDINNIPTDDSLDLETTIKVIQQQMPTFSPEQIKGLIK